MGLDALKDSDCQLRNAPVLDARDGVYVDDVFYLQEFIVLRYGAGVSIA